MATLTMTFCVTVPTFYMQYGDCHTFATLPKGQTNKQKQKEKIKVHYHCYWCQVFNEMKSVTEVLLMDFSLFGFKGTN